MKRLIILALLIARTLIASDPAPPAEPDFKALYIRANEAARQWKEAAEYQRQRAEGFALQLKAAQKSIDAAKVAPMTLEQSRHQVIPDAPPPGVNDAKPPTSFEVTLPMNQSVLVSKLGGPNEWMKLTNVQMTFIEMAIGVGGRPTRFEIRKGSVSGPEADRLTLIYQDKLGRSISWVDTPRQHSGSGIFLITDLSGL